MTAEKKRSWLWLAVLPPAALAAAVGVSLLVYRPDRPVATIAPGSSPGPAFVVQVIRPRLGLPLGGIVTPGLFGFEAHLGFDATSPGASIRRVGPRRLELGAEGWDLVVAVDAEGRVTRQTEVVFTLLFEGRPRRVRCRPGVPAVGTFVVADPGDPGELSGSFDLELARCEDADTHRRLGWPPRPLVLHGSFDRLPLDAAAPARFAARYAAAWSGGDPRALASFYAEDGILQVNDGAPAVGRAAIAAKAAGFMEAFPDMAVALESVAPVGDRLVFHWRWTGTNTGPGGTGRAVDLRGYEEWTLDRDGLIARSLGNYDEGEYGRQVGSGGGAE